MRKILCFNCHQWSTQSDRCEHCQTILSRELKEKIKEEEELRLNPPKPPSKFKLFIERLKNSKNPVIKVIYYILLSIYLFYIGIMMVIMYIISMVTG